VSDLNGDFYRTITEAQKVHFTCLEILKLLKMISLLNIKQAVTNASPVADGIVKATALLVLS